MKASKTLMTLDPHDRRNLDHVLKHLWVSMGQEEETEPYTEAPMASRAPR